jgi:hypothetical protein
VGFCSDLPQIHQTSRSWTGSISFPTDIGSRSPPEALAGTNGMPAFQGLRPRRYGPHERGSQSGSHFSYHSGSDMSRHELGGIGQPCAA